MTAVGVYLAASLVSFGVFKVAASNRSTSVSDSIDQAATPDGAQPTALSQLLQISPSEPADQACPLNGKLFTATEKNAWEQRRPLAVMIENTTDARPQSGLTNADVVFEAVAEGGITRFMALFYCHVQRNDTILAPIRSARTYFVDWASGFNQPLYVHVGGANTPGPADALGQISDYGWSLQNDMNQFSIGFPTFVRNANRIPGKEIATEHTMETSTERLWKIATKRNWTNLSPAKIVKGKTVAGADWKDGYKGWTFADGQPGKGTVAAIAYEFWTGYKDFAVKWAYDATSNTYKRSLGDAPHTDMNNDQQVAVNNVVVLFSDEKGPIDEHKHMLYATTGTGKVLVFTNGEAIEGKWVKKDRQSELQLLDGKGKPITLARGPVWVSVIDKTNTVTY